MFICKKCHDELYPNGFHIYNDWGPCEVCHNTTATADCYHGKMQPEDAAAVERCLACTTHGPGEVFPALCLEETCRLSKPGPLLDDKEVANWIDSHNLCSIEHGLMLEPEAFTTLKTLVAPDASILRWLTRNNTYADVSEGINIGSGTWQPARKQLQCIGA